MFWRVLPHANCCLAANKLFLLDLRQDRYFAVPEMLASSMLSWLERGFACSPPDEVSALLARARIVRPGDPSPTNALKERIAIPTRIDDLVSQVEALPLKGQTAAILATWTRLRLFSLKGILESRQHRGTLPTKGRDVATLSVAAGYEAGRSYAPVARNCLLDSLSLDGLLARRGLGAKLVFGVCPTPFSAHCWLQTPDRILNDSFDHVSRFTPIYAV